MLGQRMLGQLFFVVCLTLWTESVAQVEPPYSLNQSMLYFSSVNFTIKNLDTKLKKTVAFTTAVLDPSSFDNTTYASLKLNFDGEGKGDGISVTGFQLNMIIQKVSGYWSATNYTITAASAQMDGKTLTPITDLEMVSYDDMSAPLSMSFHCGRFGPIFPKIDPANPNARNFTPSIELIDFQFQAFTFKHNSTYFDNPYDCVGFFTIGIWSGIFVTILLMGILTWGIVMIMNLNTMDRFDDPKGKQITVTATD